MGKIIDADKFIGKLLELKYNSGESKIEFGDVIRLVQQAPAVEITNINQE